VPGCNARRGQEQQPRPLSAHAAWRGERGTRISMHEGRSLPLPCPELGYRHDGWKWGLPWSSLCTHESTVIGSSYRQPVHSHPRSSQNSPHHLRISFCPAVTDGMSAIAFRRMADVVHSRGQGFRFPARVITLAGSSPPWLRASSSQNPSQLACQMQYVTPHANPLSCYPAAACWPLPGHLHFTSVRKFHAGSWSLLLPMFIFCWFF